MRRYGRENSSNGDTANFNTYRVNLSNARHASRHRNSSSFGQEACQATNQRPAVTGGHRNLRVVTSRIVTVENLRVDTCRQAYVYI